MINLNIYPELCCEICQCVVGNFFDCPACSEKSVDSGFYDDLSSLEIGEDISCDKCDTCFELVEKTDKHNPRLWNWIKLNNDKN